MNRLAAAALAMVLVSGFAGSRAFAACGFPWSVTVTPVSGQNVAVSVCGIATGCLPHNRQFTIVGNEIRVTYTQAELPDCQCITPTFEFNDSVLVHPVAPGHYTVTITVINCGQAATFGTAELTLDGTVAIPLLSARAIAALALLVIAVAVWRLRS